MYLGIKLMNNLLNRVRGESSQGYNDSRTDQYISEQLNKPWKTPSYLSEKLPNFILSKLKSTEINIKQFQNLNKWSSTTNINSNSKNYPVSRSYTTIGENSHCPGQFLDRDLKTDNMISSLIVIWTMKPFVVDSQMIASYNNLPHCSKIVLVRMLTNGDYRPLFETGSEMLSTITDPDYHRSNSLQTMFDNYQVYNMYSREIKWVLSKIYKLPLSVIANLPAQKRDKLENIIIKYNDRNFQVLAEEIGMYILPKQENPVKYFLSNFVSYREVVNRPQQIERDIGKDVSLENLSRLGDLEIFKFLGIFVPYSSRENLLKNAIGIINNPGFLVPLFRKPTNSKTTLLTPTDSSIFMIGYGTIDKYRMYELEELNHAFRFMSLNQQDEEFNTGQGNSGEEGNSIGLGNSGERGILGEQGNLGERSTSSDYLRSGLLPISSISVSGRSGSLNGFGNRYRRSTSESDRIIPIFNMNRSPAIHFTRYHRSWISNPVIFPIFSRPEDPEDEFSKLEMENLSLLLSCFFGLSRFKSKENSFIGEILSKIKMGNEIKARIEMIDEEKMTKFRKLPSLEKKMVRKWLLTIFETGMYMRKWGGTGHPYPVLERDTYTNISDPSDELFLNSEGKNDPIHEQRSLISILALKDLEEHMPNDLKNLLYSLVGCNLIRGRVYRDKMDLGTRLKIITTKGHQTTDACIRLSSTILVGSGYVYICKIFHHKIQGFDPNLIDQIA